MSPYTDLIRFIHRASMYFTEDTPEYIKSGSCDYGVDGNGSIATFRFRSDLHESIFDYWSLITELLDNLDDTLSWVYLKKPYIIYGTPNNEYENIHIIKIYKTDSADYDDINYISDEERYEDHT